MTLDNILKDLHKNVYSCDESGQIKDVNLICKFLRYKYNNDELKNISQKLIAEIEIRRTDPVLWFGNRYK